MPILGPFPAGIDNRSAPNRMPTDEQGNPVFARNANNLVFRNSGDCFSRPGAVQVIQATDGKDGYSCSMGMFFRDASTIKKVNIVDGSEEAEVICTDMTGVKIAWEYYKNILYFTDGIKCKIYDGAKCQDWGVRPPKTAPSASGANVIANGIVHICYTFVMEDGRESGASPVSTTETARLVSNIETSTDNRAFAVNVYMTIPDATPESGEPFPVFHLAATIPNGTKSVDISTDYQTGRRLSTLGKVAPVPASIIRVFGSRMYMAVGPFVQYTNLNDFWLIDYGYVNYGEFKEGVISMNDDITMLAPVMNDGLFVGTAKGTFYIQATDAAAGAAVKITDAAPEAGSQTFRRDNGMPVWFADGDVIEGGPGGAVKKINSNNVSIDTSGEGGAAMSITELDGTKLAVVIPNKPVKGKYQSNDWKKIIYEGSCST